MGPIAPEAGPETGRGWDGQPLATARLRLRRLTTADAPAVVRLLDDWDVVRTTSNIPFPYDRRDADGFLAQVDRLSGAGRALVFAIEERLSGELVGCVGASLTDEGAEVGYWIGHPWWRRGYATEALRRCLRVVFEGGVADRAWAAVLPANAASRRVVEKTGFVRIGCRRAEMPARGCSADLDILELSRTAWEEGRAARPLLLVVAAALIDADGRVLLARRPEGKSMAGFWEFPGGKVQPGETPEQALARELDEELGLDVVRAGLEPLAFASHDYDSFHLLMPLYGCRVWRGTPTPREGQALAWVPAERLDDYPMPPADLPLVARLRDWL